jgi:hypothetical protein
MAARTPIIITPHKECCGCREGETCLQNNPSSLLTCHYIRSQSQVLGVGNLHLTGRHPAAMIYCVHIEIGIVSRDFGGRCK